jgi:hypothetical protein
MPTFEIYVEDDRYKVPTLHIITTLDSAAMRVIAEKLAIESPHHLSVEVRESGEPRYVIPGLPKARRPRT